MFEKLRLTAHKYDEINQKLSDPTVINNNTLYTQLMKEYKSLTPIVEKYNELKEKLQNFVPNELPKLVQENKNYGYDGVIYLSCLLEYKYGQQKDINARLKKLETCKHSIARIFHTSYLM